jgi:hypothetical protein
MMSTSRSEAMLSATSNDMMVVSLVGSINKSAILAGTQFDLSIGK